MRKLLLSFISFAAIGVVGLIAAQPVHAHIISPPISDEIYTPGNSYTGSFTIFFTEQDPNELFLTIAKMEINDVTGAKRAVAVAPSESALANWTGLDRLSVTKPAGTTYTNGDNAVEVNYVVDVPADASPGGEYAVILVSNVPREPEILEDGTAVFTGLGVGGDVTYQMIAQVEGDIVYQTSLVDFRTKDNQWLFPHLPVDFEAVFQNGGNVHVIPRGNIEVFQGGKIATITLNPGQLRTFPNTSRVYERVWSNEGIEDMEDQALIDETRANLPETFFEHVIYEIQYFRIGQFTAQLQGFAGNQPPYADEVTFWVIPWHLIIVIIVAIVLLYLVYRVRKQFGGTKYVSKSSAKYKRSAK